MELVRATMKKMGAIERLVRQVILEIYPKYYPEEVVKAFLELHRAVNIGGDIVQERVWLLYDDGVLVGTGTCEHEHITRVYVLPGCQGKGYGTYIMDVLEKMMREKYKVVSLDTSAPALAFYKHRGYEVTRVCEWQVAEGVSMSYEIMEKRFEEEQEQMKLRVLSEQFSVCKITDVGQVNWEDTYCFVGKTDEELSLVCSSKYVPADTIACEEGWRGFRIEGVLDFSLIGILAKISGVLAEHKIGIFVVSTYNTDYILVKEERLQDAMSVLEGRGYSWIK